MNMLATIGSTGAGNTAPSLTINRSRGTIMAMTIDATTTDICKACGVALPPRVDKSSWAASRSRVCSSRCANKLGQAVRALRRPTMEERFWAKVDKSHGLGPKGDCWVWTANKDRFGYGSFLRQGRTGRTAHRASYELNIGPISDGMVVRHRCDNPSCVRPDHLEIGTLQDNSNDQVARGRQRAPAGERHHANRLTEAQARAIHDDQRPLKVIATEYGITPAAAWHIRNERNWKHLWRDKATTA